ncbi:MAG: 1,4-dihydroxy-6-naphthoate synthase [Bacteroidales bacterium]|nr:1,4-dihydroxy-6-naphthoate synthase [Tenuifilaceae bacterium]
MNLSIAFSTCPNDTFIFDALVNGRIPTGNLNFTKTLADIQALNSMALAGDVDIVKISFALYPLISEKYQILSAGAALGKGVGPLVISKRKIYPDEIQYAKVAVPGTHTTANLLFSLAYPEAINKQVFLFSDIEEAILDNEVDVGVIIHENRFTYVKKGLKKISDLGDYWETQTKLPIPLGGIAIKRALPQSIKQKVNQLVRTSVEFALQTPNASYDFVRNNAQAMEFEVMQQHIELYVNNYSVNLGEFGRKAVTELLTRADTSKTNKFTDLNDLLFID